MHITIIENDQAIAETLMELLLEKDIITSCAKTVQGAELLLKTFIPDILLIDPKFGWIDANFLLSYVNPNTEVIIMSTNPKMKQTIKPCYKFIHKPFDIEALENIIGL